MPLAPTKSASCFRRVSAVSLLGPDATMPVDDEDPYEVVRDLALAAFLWSLVTGLEELEWPLAHLWRPFLALFGLTLFLAMSPLLARSRVFTS